MDCRDRAGRRVEGGEGHDRFLRGLYGTRGGRVCVKLLIQPWVSKLGGRVLNSRLSRVGIPRFIEKNKIDMSFEQLDSSLSPPDFVTLIFFAIYKFILCISRPENASAA